MIPTYIAHLVSLWKVWNRPWNRQVPQSNSLVWTPRVLDADVEVVGEVTKVLKPGQEWRVKSMATFWSARSQVVLNLGPGDEVKVTGRKGGALLIEPVNKG
jgi:membrane protein implicated in regulation of membrane protease activity